MLTVSPSPGLTAGFRHVESSDSVAFLFHR